MSLAEQLLAIGADDGLVTAVDAVERRCAELQQYVDNLVAVTTHKGLTLDDVRLVGSVYVFHTDCRLSWETRELMQRQWRGMHPGRPAIVLDSGVRVAALSVLGDAITKLTVQEVPPR